MTMSKLSDKLHMVKLLKLNMYQDKSSLKSYIKIITCQPMANHSSMEANLEIIENNLL